MLFHSCRRCIPDMQGAAEDKPKSWPLSWLQVLLLSASEWPLLVAMVMAAAVQGAIFPSFAIFFGQALEAFTFPFNQVGVTRPTQDRVLSVVFLSAWLCGSGPGPHSSLGRPLYCLGLRFSGCHGDSGCECDPGWRAADVSSQVAGVPECSPSPAQLV